MRAGEDGRTLVDSPPNIPAEERGIKAAPRQCEAEETANGGTVP